MTTPAIPEGVKRCGTGQFLLWLLPAFLVLLMAAYAMFRVWGFGLNQTNMNDAYGFAIWIWMDLAVIALGGGAFFSGFLAYIVGVKNVKNIINFAVILGVVCYTMALLLLGLDVGQPLRGWFIFWHANIHSMLTEVAFCLTIYLGVLIVEFIPVLLENPKIQKIRFFHHLAHNMHEIMAVFAATGVFLSFFHQGSLGGVPGVLYGRPFAFREGLFIWPWTFFLFTWSAAAVGPLFTASMCRLTEIITRKRLVKDDVYQLLAKISGWMLLTYIIAKSIDTIYWATVTAPARGFTLMDFYSNNPMYGIWMLIAEIVICGFLPALILITQKGRANKKLLFGAAILAIIGLCLNRWAMVLQKLAAPLKPFDDWFMYSPAWTEVITTIMPFAVGIIVISLAYRYLPLFPQERELNPGEGDNPDKNG